MSQHTYIAEGFMEDCMELIDTLTDKFAKVDWHKFCFYWKHMQFDIMFYGRQSGPEVVEFTEEVLQVARWYIITKTENFESQVVGLFIAYAITVIQPYTNLCALRILPKDVVSFKKIEHIARRDNRNDILMILSRMYLCGKIQFHVALREHAMDISIRKYFDGSVSVPQGVARRWHGRLDGARVNALEDIAESESEYITLKLAAKLASEAVFPAAHTVDTNIFQPQAKQMAESLRNLMSGATHMDGNSEESNVNSVKQKAMKQAVDPMKHLHGLADRQKEKERKLCSPKPGDKKKKSNSKHGKLASPKRNEEVPQGFSLPNLDDSPDLKDFDEFTRDGSPEPPFKGFNLKEIEINDLKTIGTPSNIGQGKKKSVRMPTDKTKSSAAELIKKSYNNTAPGFSGSKRKNSLSDPETTIKKKRKLKNKFNRKLKLTNDFNSDDSDTSFSDDSSDESDSINKTLEVNGVNTETCKGKEFTIQSKGVTKHFVEFELSDIVIRTEKDAIPEKDIEIEYIDNYTGNNALYEEVCEVSDEEVKIESEPKVTLDEGRKAAEEDDALEVFQVVTEDPAGVKQKKGKRTRKSKHRDRNVQRNFSSIDTDEPEGDETILNVLRSEYSGRSFERRRLKQPNLRSKLKKMGLLPVANFDG